MKYDLCIIGGAGHVGLPLGVAFANKHVKTVLFDINEEWLKKIQSGKFPFKEKNGDRELKRALKSGCLYVSRGDPKDISQSQFVLLVIGTPVDEYLNPDFSGLMKTIESYYSYFKNGQILILRSTVYPGTSERIQQYFKEKGKNVSIAFCPERIIEGKALEELKNFPQIISAINKKTINQVGKLFKKLTNKEVFLAKPIEAELAKLFCNAWRYIQFATANQFFMITEDQNLDYHKIYRAMTKDYPRMKHCRPPDLRPDHVF